MVTKLNDCQTARSIVFTVLPVNCVLLNLHKDCVSVSMDIYRNPVNLRNVSRCVGHKRECFLINCTDGCSVRCSFEDRIGLTDRRESLNILKLYGYRTLNRGIDLQKTPDTTTRCCCCSLCNTALHNAYARIIDISKFIVFIYFRRKFSFIISCILPTLFDIRGSKYKMVMNYLLYR